MSAETPEHKLESSLQGMAEQRRRHAGPDRDMPDPIRRALQDEIRKQFPENSTNRAGLDLRRQWALLWPRLTVAFGLFLALGVLVWQMDFWPVRTTDMAQMKPQDQEPELSPKEAPTPNPPSAPAASDADTELLAPQSLAPKVAPESEADFLAENASLGQAVDELSQSESPALFRRQESEQMSNETLGFRTLATFDEGSTFSPSATRAFRTSISTSPTAILSEFRLAHTNGQVTIVDHDGSRYLGSAVTAAGTTLSATTATQFSDAAAADRGALNLQATPAGAIHIQVSGTNQTSGQRVALTALLSTNQLSMTLGRGRSQTGAEESEASASTNTQTSAVATLSGTVRIGTNQPIQIQSVQILP